MYTLFSFLLSGSFWGVWDDASLRRIVCIREKSHVNALRIIGASRDEEDLAFLREELPKMSKVQQEQRKKECLLTVAVASIGVINVYTIDTFEVKGVRTSQMVGQPVVDPFAKKTLANPEFLCQPIISVLNHNLCANHNIPSQY